MCGIAGMFDLNMHSFNDNLFESIQNTLLRRGPDQKGIYADYPAALIHTRLSVIDPLNGKQPMKYAFGNEEYCLVYNGELYNTEEIRKELRFLGHEFTGYSDTEVLLHAYIQWKDACVSKFNGIFAFVIYEKHNRKFFIARDRIGVKPFFYFEKDGVFIFASEIKSILKNPQVKAEADEYSLAEILYLGPGRTPGCGVFKNIKELKAAHCGYFSVDGLKLRRYWELTAGEHKENFYETVEHVRYLVTDSIERQLVSDVPVATFLSGGLDSSIITSLANAHFMKKGRKLHTFSVDYADNQRYFKAGKFQPDDDKEYVDCMTEYTGAENHRVILDTEQLANALYDAVDARDLPGMADVDSSLLLFCAEIKKYAAVALSGECADEIFGGYPWYRDKEIRMKNGFPWAQSTEFRVSLVNEDLIKKINPYEYVDSRYRSTIGAASVDIADNPTERRMKEMTRLNFDWFMQTLLDRKDRMSMHNGLEVRVPYCDFRIAEYLYSVPWEMKDYEGREKGLLREAVRGLLPDKVLFRKKSPYPKTHNPAYLKLVSNRLKDVLDSPSSPLLDIIKKDALKKLLHGDNSVPFYGQLMTNPQTIAYFLQLNYWLKKYKIKLL
ncbi:MAG: asparagine synthase (glutamine-hydrolyzing) [Clostridiales bacterium]|jgi:asparagine synthase (glutamine-hydrolysing)|nr:asparagine synthase (glutamine-hydrolyzing) [Clostridiales bacterium]